MKSFEGDAAHPDGGARSRRGSQGPGSRLSDALERRQFAKPLIAFPRISDKLALIGGGDDHPRASSVTSRPVAKYRAPVVI